MRIKLDHRAVKLLGYMSIALAAVNAAIDYYKRFSANSGPYDPGVGLANEAIALIGVVALVVSSCLKNLEDRLPPR